MQFANLGCNLHPKCIHRKHENKFQPCQMPMTAYLQHSESENKLNDHQMVQNLICLQNMGVATNGSV